MAQQLELKVFTPEGEVFRETVSSVTLQSSEGEIGILPGHARYVGLLGTGILTFTNISGQRKRLVASEGFCSVEADVVTILADFVALPNGNKADLTAQKVELEATLPAANYYDPETEQKVIALKKIRAIEVLANGASEWNA